MPIHKKPVRLRTQPIRRPLTKFTRPVVEPVPEEEGAFASAQRLVGVFKRIVEIEDGHRADLRKFLERCCVAVRAFQDDPAEFERLKSDPFWEEASRQKPKDASRSKWALYFIMQAKTPNVRSRAGRYAVVLDGLIRDEVAPDAVAARIKELRGVEKAYAHFLAEEGGQDEVTLDADEDEPDDDETENAGSPIPRKGGLRAARGGNDDGVQGDAEMESPSKKGLGAVVGDHRHKPHFDRERHLLVEHEPEELKAVLAAGAMQGAPVSVTLTVTVYPPDATGFVRVVREPEACDLSKDFSSIDDEDGPSHKSLPSKKPLPPPVRPKKPLGKLKLKLKLKHRPWPGRPTSLFAK